MAEKVGGAWLGRGGLDSGIPEEPEANLGARGDRRRGRGLTGLLALAISGLVLYLAWCILWERSHPASAAARGVRKRDSAVRLKAIADLERLGSQDPEVALPALIDGLADPEPGNGAAAAEALVTVIQGVRMNDSDPGNVRDVVPALIGALQDQRPTVRARASQALSAIAILSQGPPRIIDVDAIAAALGETADDPDAEVRMAAVRGLGMLGCLLIDDPQPRLVGALEDESEEVRMTAALGLGQCSPRALIRLLPALVRSLEAARPEFRPAYLSVLKRVRPSGSSSDLFKDAIPVLISAMGSRDREVRCQILSSLGEFGPDAREAIPAMLAVLEETGEVKPADSVAVPSANDPVAAAATALARVAGKTTQYAPDGPTKVAAAAEAVHPLLKLLESPVAGRRLAAVNALRAFEHDDALTAAFIASCRDRDASVRAAALSGLWSGEPRFRSRALEVIRHALEDDSPKVRAAAATALFPIETGVEPMVPAIIRHADHDPDRSVRDACASALSALGPPAVTAAVVPMYIEALDRPGAPVLLRGQLVGVLTRFGPEACGAVPAITRALRSAEQDASREAPPRRLNSGNVLQSAEDLEAESDAWARVTLRQLAVSGLGRVAPGTPSAGEVVAVLTAALGDPDDAVKWQAVEALVAFGPAARASAPALIQLLRQARDRKALLVAGRTAEALSRIDPDGPGGREAVAFLDEVLGSKDLRPRLFAERVLGSFGPAAAPAIPELAALSRRPIVRASPELGSVATALGQIGPGTAEEGQALAALLELLQVQPELRHVETVIDAVARFGPDASAALPRVREMTRSGEPSVGEAARRAVAALEAPARNSPSP